MIENGFVDPSTDRESFLNFLGNEEVPQDFSVSWIDRAPFSDEVNKQTLIEFLNLFIEDSAKSAKELAVTYFKTLQLSTGLRKDISRESLNAAWRTWKKNEAAKKTSPRLQIIQDLLKTTLTG